MYLDTARGVNPIVQKFPFGLQQKCMMQGSHYKYTYGVPFPPFSFFVEFVCTEAKARNDHSLNSSSHSIAPGRKEWFSESHIQVRNPVSVHKADVASLFNPSKAIRQKRAADDDDGKQCPNIVNLIL